MYQQHHSDSLVICNELKSPYILEVGLTLLLNFLGNEFLMFDSCALVLRQYSFRQMAEWEIDIDQLPER